MTRIFFYGLFMDQDLLRGKGFDPKNVELAYLDGYRLVISERATLVPDPNARAFGTTMALDEDALRLLYGGDGVEDYVPIPVQANTMHDSAVEAHTYILPEDKIVGSNSAYAEKLMDVALKLSLPDNYVDEIKIWI